MQEERESKISNSFLRKSRDQCPEKINSYILFLPLIFSGNVRFHQKYLRGIIYIKGQGIGLYLIKKIIDSAGGKIEVESETGKGSTFRVYFKI